MTEILIKVFMASWQANILHGDPVARSASHSVGVQGQRGTRSRLPGMLKSLEWVDKPAVIPWPWEKGALHIKT